MGKKVLVCITQQLSSERLIKYGRELANQPDDELYVLHVLKNNWKYAAKEGVLDSLFETAAANGAELQVANANSIEKAIAKSCKQKHITHLVMGESLEAEAQQDMVRRVMELADRDMELCTVPQ